MAYPNGSAGSLLRLWTGAAAVAITGLSFSLAMVAVMSPTTIREFTQSILAILFVIGAGYLQVEQPTIDHSVIWAIVGSIVGFYFGAKVGATAPDGPQPPVGQPPPYVPPTLKG